VILRFLRLFHTFIELELEVIRLRSENESLVTQLETSDDAASSREAISKHAAERVEDLKRMVDAYSIRCDRRYVFSQAEAPVPPPQPTPPAVPARRLGRDVVREQERNFEAQMAELYREQAEAGTTKQAE
jgi:hypothetical protein